MIEHIANQVGVVVIGRNEGERLVVCLRSLILHTKTVVYVDSGSTDGSVNAAKQLGVTVLNLDLALPFTAARARNAGFDQLLTMRSDLKYVQFVDGDCEVVQGWMPAAYGFLQANPQVAVVCGRRRERYPEASIYNHMCDIEWNTPIGEAKACGGDAMMRVDCLKQVGGYRESLIAGEEPELCIRIRHAGFKVWRIDHEMTLHDAAITKFSQWWRRTVRTGHAYAEGVSLYGAPPERHWVRESRRAWIWGGILPLIFMILLVFQPKLALIIVFLYLLQWIKLIYSNKNFSTFSPVYSTFLMIGKLAEMLGQLKFYWLRLLNKHSRIIEYK
ncbi:MAG: glycosyltransferase [Methylophilus sp.]|nr:glycosyltransferase [Methylophilus sp.]